MEKFLLKHGESIVDTLGAEVDRIEMIIQVYVLSSDGRNMNTFLCPNCGNSVQNYP